MALCLQQVCQPCRLAGRPGDSIPSPQTRGGIRWAAANAPRRAPRRRAAAAAGAGRVRCAAAPQPEQPGQPPQSTVEYKDSPTDIAFINMCRVACEALGCTRPHAPGRPATRPRLPTHAHRPPSPAAPRAADGNIAGWQSSRSWNDGVETFRGMVEVSRALMKGRTAAEQRDAVIRGFPVVPPWFRRWVRCRF